MIDVSEIRDMFKQIMNKYEVIYLNSTIEWTNSYIIEGLIRLVVEALGPYKKPIVHIHVGDTHHGEQAILSTLSILERLQEEIDVITCNQFHHLHFFSSEKYISLVNIPKISPFTRHLFKSVQSHSIDKDNYAEKVWFGAIKSRFHNRRNSFLEYITRNQEINKYFTMSRFSNYKDRLIQILSTRASLYIPLSSSIGFNNVAPCYILNKEVWQYPLSEYTGQKRLAEIFNQEIRMVESKDELGYVSSREIKERKEREEIYNRHKIYENDVATTFSKFLKRLINNIGPRSIEKPTYWDSRYHEILHVNKGLSITNRKSVIAIYEDLQREIEEICAKSIEVSISKTDNLDNDAKLKRYIMLVLKDLSHNTIINETVKYETEGDSKIDDEEHKIGKRKRYKISNTIIDVTFQ